jgi:hypothetical protein
LAQNAAEQRATTRGKIQRFDKDANGEFLDSEKYLRCGLMLAIKDFELAAAVFLRCPPR